MVFSNLNYNWSNLLDMRNLQEQVKTMHAGQKLTFLTPLHLVHLVNE